MTRQEISEKTGFDAGEKFANAHEVRNFFSIESMKSMYKEGDINIDFPELVDQKYLDEMYYAVIANGWHMGT
jgi:hypothetical protein